MFWFKSATTKLRMRLRYDIDDIFKDSIKSKRWSVS